MINVFQSWKIRNEKEISHRNKSQRNDRFVVNKPNLLNIMFQSSENLVENVNQTIFNIVLFLNFRIFEMTSRNAMKMAGIEMFHWDVKSYWTARPSRDATRAAVLAGGDVTTFTWVTWPLQE